MLGFKQSTRQTKSAVIPEYQKLFILDLICSYPRVLGGIRNFVFDQHLFRSIKHVLKKYKKFFILRLGLEIGQVLLQIWVAGHIGLCAENIRIF